MRDFEEIRQVERQVDNRVSAARHEMAELRESVRELEGRVEKQGFLLRALLSLLIEKHGVTEEAVWEKVRQAEADKASAAPPTCPKGGWILSRRQNRCLYCGEARPAESAFELP
jgi:hypothetical protein